MKPSHNIFNYVLQNNNLIPEETLFVDDFARNVNAACSLGLHTILFSDAASCLEQMHELGIDSGLMITEFYAEMRFRARATKDSPKEGLKLLNQLDKHFNKENANND